MLTNQKYWEEAFYESLCCCSNLMTIIVVVVVVAFAKDPLTDSADSGARGTCRWRRCGIWWQVCRRTQPRQLRRVAGASFRGATDQVRRHPIPWKFSMLRRR